jgi:hypothetical protein
VNIGMEIIFVFVSLQISPTAAGLERTAIQSSYICAILMCAPVFARCHQYACGPCRRHWKLEATLKIWH